MDIIQILITIVGCLALLMSVLLLVQLRWPAPFLWFLKLFVSAMSPILALISALSTMVGLAVGSVFISLIGIGGLLNYFIHLFKLTREPPSSSSFERAFGLQWENHISPEQKKHFLPKRTILRLPAVATPPMEQDISFSMISDTGRQLLCDLWQPPENSIPSGLAFIYLHGSAWYLLDKDYGTRPFFRHLAAQGHVIMDVAYRVAPETDMMGMVHDVKRAIDWMKKNAASYGVNPNQIIVGGGSAGGHLALLAAYTANNPQFTPKELDGQDMGVGAVISLYGPADLKALYYHTRQHLTTRVTPNITKKKVPTQMPEWMIKSMGKDYYRLGMDKGFEHAGALAPLLGGHPDECPETYALFSPVTHVHSDCPPTLLIQGEHDLMAPVESTRMLHARLVREKVPTVMHILPQTDHAFDLIMPQISPSAHAVFFDVERFMALIAAKTEG